jgi:hypothetical protein
MKLWPRVESSSCIIERALPSSIANSMLVGKNGVFGGMLPLSIKLADRLTFNVPITTVGADSADLTGKVWRRYGYTILELMYHHRKYKNIHFTFLDVITHFRSLPAIAFYLPVFRYHCLSSVLVRINILFILISYHVWFSCQRKKMLLNAKGERPFIV